MSRVYNFSAGPAVLPEEVLKEAADEMLDYKGCGMSAMAHFHDGHSAALEVHQILLSILQDLKRQHRGTRGEIISTRHFEPFLSLVEIIR